MTTAIIATNLEAHKKHAKMRFEGNGIAWRVECSCGWESDLDVEQVFHPLGTIAEQFKRHLERSEAND